MGIVPLGAFFAAGKSLAIVHLGLEFVQQQDVINSGNAKLLEIFIGLTALALVAQAAVLVGFAIAALKAQKEIRGYVQEIHSKAMPFLDKAHGLIVDLSPEVKEITTKVNGLVGDLSPQIVGITAKINQITAHVEEISGVTRDKVQEFAPTISAANETALMANDKVRATVADVHEKSKGQIKRVNGMVSATLDATAALGRAIQYGVSQPAKEVAGVASGLKAAFETLIHRSGAAKGFGSAVKKPAPYRSGLPYPPAAGRVEGSHLGSVGEYERVKPELDL